MIKLIPFDKVFEKLCWGCFVLSKGVGCRSYKPNSHFMFSGDYFNWVTPKIECLYVKVKHFHFVIFLVSRCKLVYLLIDCKK